MTTRRNTRQVKVPEPYIGQTETEYAKQVTEALNEDRKLEKDLAKSLAARGVPYVKKKVYVAGPMTYYPEFNYPAFEQAKRALELMGWDVESPTDCGYVEGWNWKQYMRRGIAQLITCEAVATLPDYLLSRGARVEVQLAQDLGMMVLPVNMFFTQHAEDFPGSAD